MSFRSICYDKIEVLPYWKLVMSFNLTFLGNFQEQSATTSAGTVNPDWSGFQVLY